MNNLCTSNTEDRQRRFKLIPAVEMIRAMLFVAAILVSGFVHGQNFRTSSSAGRTATSLIIDKPENTMSGDVMIAAISVRSSGATITAPSGWNLVRRTNQTSGTTNAQAIYWKTAAPGDPGSFTWTFNSTYAAAGVISSFFNINTTSPINVSNGAATASSSSHTAPSITTTVSKAMVISVHSFGAAATWTSPPGMTEANEATSTTVPNSGGISMAMNYVVQATAGASGTKTSTASNYATTGVAQTLALVPLGCTTPAAPTVTSPINYCLNATASKLTATGSNLIWGVGGSTSGSGGGAGIINGAVTWIDAQYGPSTTYTTFSTLVPNVTIESIDYTIPSWQAVYGLVISIYNSSNVLVATSPTNTTYNASNGIAVTITNGFNVTLPSAGTYYIKASAGYGNIGGDNPSYPVTEPTGTVNLTGNSAGGYRLFNNIQFSVGSGGTAPTPSTSSIGSTDYVVSQVVNGCTSPQAVITVNVNGTVGTPSAIGIAAGSQPTCQLTNGTTTTTYSTSANYATSYTWSLSNASAGSINSAGVMTWANGFSGSVNIQVRANGCNGPSAMVTRAVSITPTVGNVSFTAGSSSTRCMGAGTATYTASASNSTGVTYTLDAASQAAGNSIVASTGAVTFADDWWGTTVVTATAAGCNGPKTATHTITTAASASATFTVGESCVGGSTGNITVSATGGSTPYTYSINGGGYQTSNTFNGLAAGSYTINVKTNSGCISSFPVSVTSYGVSGENQNAAGSNTWIGHVYDGINFSNYYGQYTEAETFNQSFGGSNSCFNISSGGVGRSIYTENFSVKYRMNSTKNGLYVVDLGSDDGSRLTVDGTLVYNNWSDQGFTSKPRVLMNLTGSSSLLYEFYEKSGGNQVAFQNLALVLANTLSVNTTQTLCSGNSGVQIGGDEFGILPTGISLSGTGYQWSYSTTPGGVRTNIAGATGATFTPSAAVAPFNVPGTYYIYRNATLSSTNNISPNPYTATNESNAAVITVVAAPSATISYAGSPYCTSSGTANVTLTGTTGGTFSSTAGLSINSTTGAITLGSSTGGTYTVTYTVPANGTCAAYTTTTTVTITTQPYATGSYAGNPYCTNFGLAYPTGSKQGADGVLTSSAGLFINSSNGVIDLAKSTPGDYVISYFVAAQGGCADYTTTYDLHIIASPSATISYPSTTYCTNAGLVSATRTGTSGGTFSAGAGLSINATTGQINPAASTPGTYTVTYKINAAGSCAGFTTTKNITITALPAATITYAGSPYCSNIATATVTRTGTAGGTYSSTSGLTLNASTGSVDVAASTPGSYTVTYTVAAAGGCSVFSTTANIVISTAPSASISYTDTPFCSNGGTANITLTGTQGGSYSSTAGLSINNIDGAIDLAASTPGSYTVTYTISAANGCTIFTTTTSVSISPAPNATISYAGSPYCSNIAIATVTRTGTAGGTFSSTAGLAINASTGTVDVAASTPGSYTVTYTVAAAGGCSVFSTTANIVISTAPSASISYTGTPFCSNGGTASVTLTGTQGGSFSSTAGLSINNIDGSLDLAASTPGSYTVTYTIPAANGCTMFTTTASVSISPAPNATINYAGSPYCSTSGTATATVTGTAGGVFTSSAGLNINAQTGAVNLAASTPGTYTVKYTISANGPCAQFVTTTSITITAQPAAMGSYIGNPFCSNGGTVYPSGSGSGGGTLTSTAGLVIDPNTGGINLGTSTPGTYTVTYTVQPSGGCGLYTASTTVTIIPAGTWTGSVSTDWTNSANWLCGGVPTISTNVTIPAGLNRYPVIATTATTKNLTIGSGASVTNTGTLQIAGAVTSSGTLTTGTGTVEFKGTTLQTISNNLFANNAINNLTVNNTAGVTLQSPIELTGALTISKGRLNTNGFLTLKSGVNTTARIAPITSTTSNPVNGTVTVERYVPGRRKYRLITSSVTTSTAATLKVGEEALSIWGNWQNMGKNNEPHAGTFITGGTQANGFDVQTLTSSLFTYVDSTRSFLAFSSANRKNTKYTPLKAGVPYFMFVYGDRLNSVSTSSPNETVLTAKGTVLTGDQSYTTTSTLPLSNVPGRFTFIGNPFASPVNWVTMPKANIANTFWGFDPNLSSTGGYVTVSTLGEQVIVSPRSGNAAINQYIQPGQGFFVKTTAAAPSLTIREQDKVSNTSNLVFRGSGAGASLIAVNLMYDLAGVKTLTDGAVAVFDETFNNELDDDDAPKMTNSAELLAIAQRDQLLSIDARSNPSPQDTVFLQVGKLTRAQYTLQVFTEHMESGMLMPYLYDKYLNVSTPISLGDTTYVNISTSASIPASVAADRFKIVFKEAGILPIYFTETKAVNREHIVQVSWQLEGNGSVRYYEIEHATDGVQFSVVGKVDAGLQLNSMYTWLHTGNVPGQNYYRIKAVQDDGHFVLSKVVVVKSAATDAAPLIKVIPNPITGRQFIININNVEPGAYVIKLFNSGGQEVHRQMIVISSFNKFVQVELTKKLPAGIYVLKCQGCARNVSANLMVNP